MKKIKFLFVTWDGPQTTYMEGLFMPIFNEISKTLDVEFHVMQFTWGDKARIEKTNIIAKKLGIIYTSRPIFRKPTQVLGSIYTLWKGVDEIRAYLKDEKIDVVMPRGNFPATMVNAIKGIDVIFDCDGLPLEERVDFGGLSRKSIVYKFLKRQEIKMLLKAKYVLVRSNKAIEIHLKTIGENYRNKFGVVFNGRNSNQFDPQHYSSDVVRNELNFGTDDFVFVYCGSLGPQYCWQQMIDIFTAFTSIKSNCKFLIITGDTDYAYRMLNTQFEKNISIISVSSYEVPKYLAACNVGMAIRNPTFSMQGIAPIKLGEYLLMGLPTIASKGIGDTEKIIENIPGCFLYDHHLENKQLDQINAYLTSVPNISKQQIRTEALKYFSLQSAAESYIKVISKINTYE